MICRNTTLKKRRTELGLTQQEACDLTGIKLSTWQKWEQGVNDVSDPLWEQANEKLDEYEEGKQCQ